MITRDQAERLAYGQTLSYQTDSGRIIRVRVTGKPKVWKTRPKEFKVPVKHGLRDSGYLTHENAARFTTED